MKTCLSEKGKKIDEITTGRWKMAKPVTINVKEQKQL